MSSTKSNGVPKAKVKQHEAIMGTNDYSTVSKRSVEKLYLREEPEFLRAFVHKFKRRTPLINRGYWLRMRAIEAVVKCFLNEETGKSKAVVNVGCGYEPLAFRMLWKYSKECQNVKFLDVDFPQLIQKKLEIITTEPSFQKYLDGAVGLDALHDSTFFDSERYCAVGCDLSGRDQLQYVLNDKLGLTRRSILFIDDSSTVYMPPKEATHLLQSCRAFPDARFCLLEQHSPAGEGHPFVQTMVDHFNKQTPLRKLSAHNTIASQSARFTAAGWHAVQATDLWSLWQNQNFISDDERIALDDIEPFDEWEGFALFASHYFLLLATTADARAITASWRQALIPKQKKETLSSAPITRIMLDAAQTPKGYGRVNGAILKTEQGFLVHCGGIANNTRQGPHDIYAISGHKDSKSPIPPVCLSCHTIASLGDGSSLLVGGRTSSTRASSECYLSQNDQWTLVADIQPGRYRHCAVTICVGRDPGVLVFGGRTGSGEVLDHWSLFLNHKWQKLAVTGNRPPPLFGAAMATTESASGVLVGGLAKNGRLHPECGFWRWDLQAPQVGPMQIQATFVVAKYPTGRISRTLQRFGAISMAVPSGVLLIGGVGLEGPLQPNEELVMLRKDDSLVSCAPVLGDSSPPPMFIGHSITKISDQELVMVGGGMVCFSFGTFWNDHIYRLRLNDACENSAGRMWKLLTDPPKEADVKEPQGNNSNGSGQTAPVVQVPIHSNVCVSLKGVHIPRLNEPSVIQGSIHRGTVVPFVIESLNLGLCTTVWTKDYLIEKVGSEKLTIIHSASSPHLSFREKNFAYETVPFRTFTNAAAIGSHVYMRALSTSKPSKLPASLANDYPTLATDFQVPEALKFAEQYQHSSVLRISGNVNMWLHYDVMSNILCQVTGSKRVILFPPEDVSHLDFPPGATTSNLDIFRTDAGCFGDCSPMETTLSAGEVLFIPACWPHATAPAIDSGDGGLSVAVNVFFKSFDDKLYAAGRDVYGNRDLEMYQNGRKHVAKIIGLVTGSDGIENITSLAERVRKKERVANDAATALGHKEVNRIIASARDVPDDVARFYLARLADELLVGVEKL